MSLRFLLRPNRWLSEVVPPKSPPVHRSGRLPSPLAQIDLGTRSTKRHTRQQMLCSTTKWCASILSKSLVNCFIGHLQIRFPSPHHQNSHDEKRVSHHVSDDGHKLTVVQQPLSRATDNSVVAIRELGICGLFVCGNRAIFKFV
jgi:hypothetical protein